jgi:hypothetical protein
MIFIHHYQAVSESGELATFSKRIEAPSWGIAEKLAQGEVFQLIEEIDMEGNVVNFENLN